MFWPRMAKGAPASGSTLRHGRVHAALIGPNCHTRGCDIRAPNKERTKIGREPDRSTDPQAPSTPNSGAGASDCANAGRRRRRRGQSQTRRPSRQAAEQEHAASTHRGSQFSRRSSRSSGHREDQFSGKGGGLPTRRPTCLPRHTRLLTDSDSTSPLVLESTSAIIPSYGLILAIRSTTLRFRHPPMVMACPPQPVH
jgi:hypothetical protein